MDAESNARDEPDSGLENAPDGTPPPAHGTASPPLSATTRILLWVLGWVLLLLGVLGLVLPGLQGVLTLLLAGAVLSLVSPGMYRFLRRIFERWPRGWKRLLRIRGRVLRWLSR